MFICNTLALTRYITLGEALPHKSVKFLYNSKLSKYSAGLPSHNNVTIKHYNFRLRLNDPYRSSLRSDTQGHLKIFKTIIRGIGFIGLSNKTISFSFRSAEGSEPYRSSLRSDTLTGSLHIFNIIHGLEFSLDV